MNRRSTAEHDLSDDHHDHQYPYQQEGHEADQNTPQHHTHLLWYTFAKQQIAGEFLRVGRYYNPANAEMVAPGSSLKISYSADQPGTRLVVRTTEEELWIRVRVIYRHGCQRIWSPHLSGSC